jgi:hypothetical protein
MQQIRAVIGVAWVPLLSGCMAMGGLGHTSGLLGTGLGGHMESDKKALLLQRAEASNGGLTIGLSFPPPTSGTVVTISALLRSDPGDQEPTEGEIWLRVQTPGGSVDRLRMQSVRSSGAATHRARYGFVTPGLYVVTADARLGTGADVRTVSVTTKVEVSRAEHVDRHLRLQSGLPPVRDSHSW